MYNPFFGISKADDLSNKDAGLLFVPEASPIWTQVQNPLNQLIVGPRGAGKTMALRQLDHHTQHSSLNPPYIGLYIQISRISTIFQSLFDESIGNEDRRVTRFFQRVFSEYIWLEIVRELSLYLQDQNRPKSTFDSKNIARATGITANDLEELHEKAMDRQNKIDRAIENWTTTNKYQETPAPNLATSLARCVDELRTTIKTLDSQQPCLYLLFDESSPIPLPCQEVINSLLHRGRSYCVKLAVRPYEWDTLSTLTARKIELNTDVWPLYVEYHEERSSQYIYYSNVVLASTPIRPRKSVLRA